MTARILPANTGPSPLHVLSKSTASILVNKSPRHAIQRKRREVPDESSDEMDQGTIVHALMLGASNKRIVELDYPDFRTKAARTARDEATARGDVPVLKHKADVISGYARKLKVECERLGFPFDGESEVGIEWSEFTSTGDEVTCWGALDHFVLARGVIYDLKIVESAHPRAMQRHLLGYGGDIQATAYTRAVEALHPHLAGRTRFVFLACELYSGIVQPIELGGGMRRLGEMKWRRAIETWARCLREDNWPGYTTGIATVDAPEWAIEDEMMHTTAINAARGEAFLEDD